MSMTSPDHQKKTWASIVSSSNELNDVSLEDAMKKNSMVMTSRSLGEQSFTFYRYTNKKTRVMKYYDYHLTPEEEKIHGDTVRKHVMCHCCDAMCVSVILGRDFHPCHRCYCCAGDDPYITNAKVIINGPDRYTIIIPKNKEEEMRNDKLFKKKIW